jgi:hypothetical protein
MNILNTASESWDAASRTENAGSEIVGTGLVSVHDLGAGF